MRLRTVNAVTGIAEWLKSSGGALLALDPASAPTGTVIRGSDQGIPATATQAFTGAAATFIDVTVAQWDGSAAAWDAVYLVFNSADAATDLANVAVRYEMAVQNGIGETRRFVFATGTLVSMHYKSVDAAATMVIHWEYK
jgi:hypothetical protein